MLVSKSLWLGSPGPPPTCGGTTPPPGCLEALFCHGIGPHRGLVTPVHVHQGEESTLWAGVGRDALSRGPRAGHRAAVRPAGWNQNHQDPLLAGVLLLTLPSWPAFYASSQGAAVR